MKVKVLCRNPDDYLRETKRDIYKVPRNYDPSLHPFEAPREYTRAINAVKLERVFAKPFVGNLDGHRDGVACLAKHPRSLSCLLSGSYDGELRMWDIPTRKCVRSFQGHEGYVRDITFATTGERFLTVGDDKTIKTWKSECPGWGEDEEPTNTIISKTVIFSVSHHQNLDTFATCGDTCQIWEETRNEPIKVFQWGVDSLYCVRFSPVEKDILASCASDRSIILYDMREANPLRKVVLQLRCNKICWNPMEAFSLSCANEDYSVYTFDTRKLSAPAMIHKGHVSAVTDIDYAPTGKEFVTGSYDKTVRIFPLETGYSREVYHTKRMQRLTCVQWSLDNKFVFSGSDEMNIRVWKARASEKLGLLRPREKAALQYNEALKEKFKNHPEVRRIAHHRQIPKHVYSSQKELRIIKDKQKRKEANRRANSRPGTVPSIPERRKCVVREEK